MEIRAKMRIKVHSFGPRILHLLVIGAIILPVSAFTSRRPFHGLHQVMSQSYYQTNRKYRIGSPSTKMTFRTQRFTELQSYKFSSQTYQPTRVSTGHSFSTQYNSLFHSHRSKGCSSISMSSSALHATSSDEIKRKAKRKPRKTSASALHATSSDEIKRKATRKPRKASAKKPSSKSLSKKKDNETHAPPLSSASSRLSRAVAKAAAARVKADLEGASTTRSKLGSNNKSMMRKVNNQEQNIRLRRSAQRTPTFPTSISSSTSSIYKPPVKESTLASKLKRKEQHQKDSHAENDQSNRMSSLTELTQVIDSQLFANGHRGDLKGDFPQVSGIVQSARDNMISLLGFNHLSGDYKEHSSGATYNVAVVFSKPLVRDQITVEYASRIRTLCRMFTEDPEFRPSLVCFCGCKSSGNNHVSDVDAGYIFFRHMCEAQNVDLDEVGIFLDTKSNTDETAFENVAKRVRMESIPKWLDKSPICETGQEEYGQGGAYERKRIHVHFTLVSTEYHLCNINDIHYRSPRKSLLKEIEDLEDNYVFSSSSLNAPGGYTGGNGVAKTSWSFQYATYPYIHTKNESVVFLGKCFLLAEELMPLLTNMKGVVDQTEFFQQDNFQLLTSIRRSLVNHVESLHDRRAKYSKPHLKKALISYSKGMQIQKRGNIQDSDTSTEMKDVIGVLEGALLSLGRCVDLVRPASLQDRRVSKDDWKRALDALEHSINEIRDICDPDRPLRPSEWGKLVDDETNKVESP